MAYAPSDGSGSNENTPKPADLANIAQAAADVANNLPSALDFDKERGLLEPLAEDVAKEAIDEVLDEVDDYLKDVKPEIVEDMKKCSKKCGGGCSGKTQRENKKKGGSCGRVSSCAVSSSCSASPGFQPPAALMIRAELEAARKIALGTTPAVAATLAAVPSIVTTAEGSLAGPTIAQLTATLTELAATLESLILTQDALIKNMGVGL